jgi:hypothetical protein
LLLQKATDTSISSVFFLKVLNVFYILLAGGTFDKLNFAIPDKKMVFPAAHG